MKQLLCLKLFFHGMVCLLLILQSCSNEPIKLNIKPKESEPKIVIYGQITDQPLVEPPFVRITLSSSFYNPLQNYYIDNAFVTLSDDLGNVWEFHHTDSGYYRPASLPQIIAQNQNFHLKVNHNGKLYEYKTKMIPISPNRKFIDSLTYQYRSRSEPGTFWDGYYIALWGGKDEKTAPYLYLKIYENGKLKTRFSDTDNRQTIFLAESRFFQNTISGVHLPGAYKLGDKIRIAILSISKNEFDYLNALSNQMNNGGGIFDGPPANVKSNFTNDALGVFLSSSVEWDTLTIR